MRRKITTLSLCLLALATPGVAGAAIDPETKVALDTVWVLVTAFLVFFMNAGFALVESGLCRAKNAVNILAKNFIVFAASSLAFWVIGFGLMFGDGSPLHRARRAGCSTAPTTARRRATPIRAPSPSLNWTGVPLCAKFFFQLVFAGTAATIVSGAVAERIKFGTFIVFSFILVGVDLSDRRPLDLGRRLAVGARDSATSPARPSCTPSAAGRRWRASSCSGRASASTAGRQGQADSRPQHDLGDARLL